MGFPANGAIRAALACPKKVELAVEWCFEHSTDADFDDPFEPAEKEEEEETATEAEFANADFWVSCRCVSVQQTSDAAGGGGRSSGGAELEVGDTVTVLSDVETVKALAADHGGWAPSMAQVCRPIQVLTLCPVVSVFASVFSFVATPCLNSALLA